MSNVETQDEMSFKTSAVGLVEPADMIYGLSKITCLSLSQEEMLMWLGKLTANHQQHENIHPGTDRVISSAQLEGFLGYKRVKDITFTRMS